jgi:WD40-like Beta Propeller Repeat
MTTSPEAGSPAASQSTPSDRLDSWKEIAAYFRRAERTVRRWEVTESLPVHRHAHKKRGSVYAYKCELDAWWHSRQNDLEPVNGSSAEESGATRRLWLVSLVLVVVILSIVGLMSTRASRGARAAVAPQVRSLTAYQGLETAPSFSPDGTRLAFVWNGEQQDNFDIYVRMVDEGPLHRLTTNPATDYNPAWSPDGQSLAFLRSRGESSAEILLMTVARLHSCEVQRSPRAISFSCL